MNDKSSDWVEIPTEEPAPEGSQAVLMESQDAGRWLRKLYLLELRSRPDYGDGSAAAGLLDAVSGLIEHDEALKETQE